jgi:integrase
LPIRPKRIKPYLYSDEQIRQLLKAAKDLPATHSLRPWTHHCLLGVLAVTGLRISEALNLRPADIDWSESVLTIRNTKFGKSRLVPLHASSLQVLSDYAGRRDRLFPNGKTNYFFPSLRNGRLDEAEVRRTFYALSRQIGIAAPWPAEDLACTTSGIVSPFTHCCVGTAMGKTSGGAYPSCLRIWVTGMSPTPTGT